MSNAGRPTLLCLCAALFTMVGTAAFGEDAYRVRPGDALELSAVGMPDLRYKTMIGADGRASFPLLGSIEVAGTTLSDVRQKIQSLLPNKVFRRRTPEGKEYSVVVAPDEINIVIAEYRPVYLNGDVSKPGEQSYRPGMTVHQAIALAGGYEIMRFRMNNPFLDAADFRSEYNSLQLSYLKQSAVVSRLRMELEGQTDQQKDADAGGVVKKSINDGEAEQLLLRVRDFENEKSSLIRTTKTVAEREQTLKEQLNQERSGTNSDLEELQRIRDLSQKGTLPFTRVTEARRLALLSSTSLLQTGAMLGQAVRERQELERKIEKLSDQRRLDLVVEIENSTVELAKLASRIDAVKEKLAYTGILRSQLARGDTGAPKLVIFRSSDGNRERIEADESNELQPGDVVEVALRTETVDTMSFNGNAENIRPER